MLLMAASFHQQTGSFILPDEDYMLGLATFSFNRSRISIDTALVPCSGIFQSLMSVIISEVDRGQMACLYAF